MHNAISTVYIKIFFHLPLQIGFIYQILQPSKTNLHIFLLECPFFVGCSCEVSMFCIKQSEVAAGLPAPSQVPDMVRFKFLQTNFRSKSSQFLLIYFLGVGPCNSIVCPQ